MTILCWIRNMTQHNLWWLDMRSSPSLSRSSSSRSRFRRRSTPTTTIFAKFFADDFFSTAIWRSTSLRYCTTSASATASLSLYIFKIYFYLFLLDPVVGNLFNCFFELLLWVDPAKKHFSDDDLPNKVNKESPPQKNRKNTNLGKSSQKWMGPVNSR